MRIYPHHSEKTLNLLLKYWSLWPIKSVLGPLAPSETSPMENTVPRQDNGIRLKRQILLPFSLACACLFFFSLFSIYREEEEHIDRDFLATAEAAQKIYDELQKNHQKTLNVAMEFVLQDKTLKAAYRSGNRETLFMAAIPVFERLRHDQSITHFYFMEPGRKNFLRVHQPERDRKSVV